MGSGGASCPTLAAGAALASLGDEESNFSQLIRSVGKLARKTSKPVVESVSEKLEQIEREKPARDLFPSGEAGRETVDRMTWLVRVRLGSFTMPELIFGMAIGRMRKTAHPKRRP